MFLFPFWLMWQLLYEGSDSSCYSLPEISGGKMGGGLGDIDIANLSGEVLALRPLWSLQGEALLR